MEEVRRRDQQAGCGAGRGGRFRGGGLGALGLFEALEFHFIPLPLPASSSIMLTALLILPFSLSLPARYCLSCGSCDFSVPAYPSYQRPQCEG
jgi:hypothetical protein